MTEHINPIKLDQFQSTPVVFGLKGVPSDLPQALGRDPQLHSMDAPELIPAGSMVRSSIYGGFSYLMESTLTRGE